MFPGFVFSIAFSTPSFVIFKVSSILLSGLPMYTVLDKAQWYLCFTPPNSIIVPSFSLNFLSVGVKWEAEADLPLAKIIFNPEYSPPIWTWSFPAKRVCWILPAT